MLPIHFAPLQGYTEAPYRRIHHDVCGGVEAYYTPFIRLEHGKARPKDMREAQPDGLCPFVPQVIVSSGAELETLAGLLMAQGHRAIDINMGCPFPLQTRLGRGSGLLPHADRVAGVLDVVRRLTDERGVAFSVKTRLGHERLDEMQALLPLLNAAPLSHVTLHPRLGVEGYEGELHWPEMRAFCAQSAHPVVFNGLLTSVADMERVAAKVEGLAGLMVGRGLLARPTLAAEYASGQPCSDDECRRRVLEMHRRLFDHYQQALTGGERQFVLKMHDFWDYLEPLFGHKQVKKIRKSGNLRNYLAAVAQLG